MMKTQKKSHLSTKLDQHYLDVLRDRLPVDWAEKVKAKNGLSLSKIRSVLRSPDNYDESVIDEIIGVADDYQKEVLAKLEEQKLKIENLSII